MKNFISIVTPTYNEEDNIEQLCLKISSQMKNINDVDYEHIVIDNDSTDTTQEKLEKLAGIDKKLKVIFNLRNFGQIRSPFYGILQARGEAIILLASDFQDPVELIPELILKWRMGHEAIMLQRNKVKKFIMLEYIKEFFYRFINKISEVNLTKNTTGSGIYDKKVIDRMRLINEPYPYFRGLVAELVKNIEVIKFNQPLRTKGNSKNNFFSLYDYAILGLIKHSKIPLRIMTIFGFGCSVLFLLIGIMFLTLKILFWDIFSLGVAPVILGIFGSAAIQIFLLGMIGEYVGYILTHVRNLPLVIEKKRINFY
jgi:polyisoprenyl-phosphate glycosyltransferase